MKKTKLVYISTLYPPTHYSQYVLEGLQKLQEIQLIVYTSKTEKTDHIDAKIVVRKNWTKRWYYVLQIINTLRKDRPNIIHLQHEINMYGGTETAILFPALLLLARLCRIKIVVTIHSVVSKKQVDRNFINFFKKESAVLNKLTVKIFLSCLYKSIVALSDKIIVHTELSRNLLVDEYNGNRANISKIEIPIPERRVLSSESRNYFFYFGYMVKRKGLDEVLMGFKDFIRNNPNSQIKIIMAGGTLSGQEHYRKEILDLIRQNDMCERVSVKGFVEQTDLDHLYAHAMAVICPAKISIAASSPVSHAMSYGKCIIASDIGHLREEISHLRTGFLTKNDQWRNAFQCIMERPDLVEDIESQIRLENSYRTPFKTAIKHLEVYKNSIGD